MARSNYYKPLVSSTIIFDKFLWYLRRVENPSENLPAKSKNGKTAFTDEIAKTIIDACGSGFTLEKAAELVGLNPVTVQGWTKKRPAFGDQVRMARKKHELKLLKDIELAGEKSWQAKAWMAERVYSYAQPSSRLSVDTSVTHGVNGSFAALLAGLASRRAEKKAQVIAISDTDAPKLKQLGNSHNHTDKEQLAKEPKNHLSLTNYCINSDNNVDNKDITKDNLQKRRGKQMRRRKPRAESLKKWPVHDTPPTTPPATDLHL